MPLSHTINHRLLDPATVAKRRHELTIEAICKRCEELDSQTGCFRQQGASPFFAEWSKIMQRFVIHKDGLKLVEIPIENTALVWDDHEKFFVSDARERIYNGKRGMSGVAKTDQQSPSGARSRGRFPYHDIVDITRYLLGKPVWQKYKYDALAKQGTLGALYSEYLTTLMLRFAVYYMHRYLSGLSRSAAVTFRMSTEAQKTLDALQASVCGELFGLPFDPRINPLQFDLQSIERGVVSWAPGYAGWDGRMYRTACAGDYDVLTAEGEATWRMGSLNKNPFPFLYRWHSRCFGLANTAMKAAPDSNYDGSGIKQFSAPGWGFGHSGQLRTRREFTSIPMYSYMWSHYNERAAETSDQLFIRRLLEFEPDVPGVLTAKEITVLDAQFSLPLLRQARAFVDVYSLAAYADKARERVGADVLHNLRFFSLKYRGDSYGVEWLPPNNNVKGEPAPGYYSRGPGSLGEGRADVGALIQMAKKYLGGDPEDFRLHGKGNGGADFWRRENIAYRFYRALFANGYLELY